MNLELDNVELTDSMAESPWNYCCSTASIRRQLMQMHDISTRKTASKTLSNFKKEDIPGFSSMSS